MVTARWAILPAAEKRSAGWTNRKSGFALVVSETYCLLASATHSGKSALANNARLTGTAAAGFDLDSNASTANDGFRRERSEGLGRSALEHP